VLDGREEFDVRGDASAAHIDQIHELGGHHCVSPVRESTPVRDQAIVLDSIARSHVQRNGGSIMEFRSRIRRSAYSNA
jgi:hypothetical protein